MDDIKFWEYHVTLDPKTKKIVKKTPTSRKFVMITEKDAAVNNSQKQFTGLYYEKAPSKKAEAKK